MRRRYALAIAIAGLVTLALTACGSGGHAGNPSAWIACVDDTISTDGLRTSYLPGLEDIAEDAATEEGQFFASDCGANATGTARWPIHKRFEVEEGFDGELAAEAIESQARHLTPRLEQLTTASSTHSGTPLGQMLAVAARQCAAAGGHCHLVMFTDGGWADHLLRVKDGVTTAERRRYLTTYAPRLHGLVGASVVFAGVGAGTHLGEPRLGKAKRIATELVERAGGHVVSWNVRLPSTLTHERRTKEVSQ
jgi:hypothetical protein